MTVSYAHAIHNPRTGGSGSILTRIQCPTIGSETDPDPEKYAYIILMHDNHLRSCYSQTPGHGSRSILTRIQCPTSGSETDPDIEKYAYIINE